MKFSKKLFKHGGSLAVVIPSEFTQLLASDEVTLEFTVDDNNNPSLIVKPTNELDTIESDPLFAVFLQAIYKNAMENPHTLKDSSELFNERVQKLIECVDTDDDENC